MKALVSTNFNFAGQKSHYVGKVRDVYNIENQLLAMVVSDRISAFDVVLPKGIPFKGEILNKIAAKFLDATSDILPNWKIAVPDAMVTLGKLCEPFKVEMVVRGYLAGSAWREYKAGMRELCGVKLPEGMKENDKFPTPIITPTTKADEGHDENISKEEIIASGLVSKEDYEQVEKYTLALFERGIVLADGYECKPAKLEIIEENKVRITITEGKYHQIKRMNGVVGLGVNELHRESMGNTKLPEDLEPG